MIVQSKFAHYNFNVYDLDKALDFYKKALNLTEKRRRASEDGSFILVYLTDGQTPFELELTWLREWDRPYNMGDNEVHLCVSVAGDYGEVFKYHKENGWVCYENTAMGLYFISDPDDHWIEVVKEK
ncbi:MAG: VOC family protein [Clostridiales bacterium]|jgi:lactoylglutathione lyase|nr:VOC family protein [Clostridiales bacterium]